MSNKLYEETHIQNIANAIREKTGKTDPLKVSGMAAEIESVKVYVDPKLQDKTVTENGTVEADEGYDGLGKVTVEVVEDLSNISELLGTDVGDTKAEIETGMSDLIDLANETTGNTDTNLTDGVNALVDGYGQGSATSGIAYDSSIKSLKVEPYRSSFINIFNVEQMNYSSNVSIIEEV